VLLVITSLTGTVCGLFEAPVEVREMLPVYVPAVIPEAFTLTFTVAGVEPVAGLTLSQAPPDAAAVKFRAVPVLVTARFWLPDVAPPAA
jgi:hypothetical protein